MTTEPKRLIATPAEARALHNGGTVEVWRAMKPQPFLCNDRLKWYSKDYGHSLEWRVSSPPPKDACVCGPFPPGSRWWVAESFWCINDTDSDGYHTIDCGSCLTIGQKYARIQFVASPEYLTPPELEHQQTVKPYTGAPCPGEWQILPPDDWDGTEEQFTVRGQWDFLPWQFYTRHTSAQMPRWASRTIATSTACRVELRDGVWHWVTNMKGEKA